MSQLSKSMSCFVPGKKNCDSVNSVGVCQSQAALALAKAAFKYLHLTLLLTQLIILLFCNIPVCAC